jgi:LuxR family maltose regulon positive regulatory protein
VIDPSALALTRDETAELLTGTVAWSKEVTDAAHDALEGWPLATRTLELELRHHAAGADLRTALAAVARLLATEHPTLPEALADPQTLDFATRVAVADWLTSDLAALLAPGSDVDSTLNRLETEGLGAWSDAREGREFRLQPFVRSAVLQASTLATAERDALRRTYARWADDNGLTVIAGREAVAIADWQLLADISQRNYRRIMLLHRRVWADLLKSVPLDRMRRLPVLAAVYVQLLNADSAASDRLRALATLLLDSVAPLRERGSTVDRIWRNSSMLAAERVTGRYAAAGVTAERLDSLVGRLDPDAYRSLDELLPILYVHIGTTRLYNGDPAGAEPAFKDALRVDFDAPWSHLHAKSMLALLSALEGDMARAADHAASLERDVALTGWRGTYSASGFHLARALIAIDNLDAATAREEVDALAQHYDTIEHWPVMLRVRALIALLEGSAARAAMRLPAEIRIRSHRAQTSAPMRTMLAVTHADLLLAAGETAAAAKVLARADAQGSPAVLAALGRVAVAIGDDSGALSISAALLGRHELAPRHIVMALLTRAIAAHRLGRDQESAQTARQALEAVRSFGLRLPLALMPRQPLAEVLDVIGEGDALDGVPDLVPGGLPQARLTRRELAVLAELAASPSVRVIAESLFVSPNTVKSQVRSLYRKLGVSNREDALSVAAAAGLLAQHSELR